MREVQRQQVTVQDAEGVVHIFALVTGTTKDGEAFVQLDPVNCNLEGEEPGLYYLTAAKP